LHFGAQVLVVGVDGIGGRQKIAAGYAFLELAIF
jgi:hypothetical protein